MRSRAESHAAQIAKVRVIPHLGDKRMCTNGEIGERDRLWTHEIEPIQHT